MNRPILSKKQGPIALIMKVTSGGRNINAVYSLPLSPLEKLILQFLCGRLDFRDLADGSFSGETKASVTTICNATSLSRNAVIKHLKNLQAKGYVIARKVSKHSVPLPNCYKVTAKVFEDYWAILQERAEKRENKEQHEKAEGGGSARDALGVVHEMHYGSARDALHVSLEESPKESLEIINKEKVYTPPVLEPSPRKLGGPLGDAFQSMLSKVQKEPETKPQPQPQKPTQPLQAPQVVKAEPIYTPVEIMPLETPTTNIEARTQSPSTIAERWAEFTKEAKPHLKPDSRKYADCIKKLQKHLQCDENQMHAILDFVMRDDFWRNNALSPCGLLNTSKNGLKKIDNLISAMHRPKPKKPGSLDRRIDEKIKKAGGQVLWLKKENREEK